MVVFPLTHHTFLSNPKKFSQGTAFLNFLTPNDAIAFNDAFDGYFFAEYRMQSLFLCFTPHAKAFTFSSNG